MRVRTQIIAGHVPALRSVVRNFRRDESGATSIEYALIATLMCVIVIGALTALGTTLSDNFLLGVTGAISDAMASKG
ncbi:Flp family type IVb pilin [Roseibium sp.]|uniref:Flp family type IVb pilin n=1 Tax=Roseibium sp. TaxID=1936156 RepID=UPI003D14FF8E